MTIGVNHLTGMRQLALGAMGRFGEAEMAKGLGKFFRGFARKSDGGATVEAVLWLPAFFIIFGLIVDVSMIFNGHSLIMRTIQDGNRNFSVGRLSSTAATEAWVEARLQNLAPHAVATTTEYAGVATTVVVVPATDLEILGMFNVLNNINLTIRSDHFIEY